MPSLLMVYFAVMVSGFSVSVMMAVVVVPTVWSTVVWVPSSMVVLTIMGVLLLVAGLVVGYSGDFLHRFGQIQMLYGFVG